MNVYKPHSITFPTDPISHIWQISNWRPTPGHTPFEEYAASGVVPLFLGTHTRTPAMEFETVDLDRMITNLDATFKIFAAYTTPVIVKWLKKVNLGMNEAVGSTVHQSLSLARALLSFESLSAQQDALATMSMGLRALAAADGSPAPVVASNATLVAPTVCNLYTLGPLTINTASVCAEGVVLNNNITHDVRRCNNSVDPTYTAIDRIQPTLTITTPEVDKVMSHFVTPSNVTAVAFFLRRKATSQINVADATAQHLRFAATAGSAAQTGENEITIRLAQSMAITTSLAVT